MAGVPTARAQRAADCAAIQDDAERLACYDCSGLRDGDERLACYDRSLRRAEPIVRTPSPAPAAAPPAAAPSAPQAPAAAAPAAAAPAASAPQSAPRQVDIRGASRGTTTANEPFQIMVVAYQRAQTGTRFQAEDGSVWVQTDGGRAPYIPPVPFPAEIRPGALGSMFLVPANTHRAIRVRRAQ